MKHRRTNRAKRFDPDCRNHGWCPWCRDNRTYSNKHRAPSISDEWFIKAERRGK